MNKLEWIDKFEDNKLVKIYTKEHIYVEGLNIIGKQKRQEATSSLPDHLHENAFEFVYFVSGQAILSIGDKNYRLSGGDAFFTDAGEIHSTNMIPMSVCELYWFRISSDLAENLLFLNKEATSYLCSSLRNLKERKIQLGNPNIPHLLEKALAYSICREKKFIAAECLLQFIYEVIENQTSIQFKLTPDIGNSLNYILDNINKKLSLDEIASNVFLSESQFKQKFKKQMGIAPRQYINFQKMEIAKELLLENKSIEYISTTLGYENTSYFTVIFKRFNSCSPSQFRSNAKGQ